MNLETARADYEHDLIRHRLLFCLNTPDYQELKERQWSYKFEDLMRNRLAVGFYRYGDNRIPLRDYGAYMSKKLRNWEKTGNDELLVDIANLCMLTFKYGVHPNKHFKAIDRVD